VTRLVPLAAALALLALPTTASAADFVVSNPGDDGTGGCTAQECTLREAVAASAPVVDRVIVPAGSYTLTQGPLTLDRDTIAGAGARVTIIDSGNSAHLTVRTLSNQVSGVTLTGGTGSHLQGPLVGGAIVVEGPFAPSALTLIDSAVRGNTANGGGGIGVRSGGTLSVVGSTISGNTSTGVTGSHGGGVFIDGGTATLTNSTVSGNTAIDTANAAGDADGGGIYAGGGTLTLQNVTVAGNRASTDDGVFRTPAGAATVTLNSTIVSGVPALSACGGSPPAGANILADDSSCGGAIGDARLAALADNGGPTDTHALGAGSAAMDGGGPGCPASDQRGVARVGPCDIGAFEYVPPVTPPLPPPDEELPPPRAGKSVNALPKSGTVRVKLPGRKRFRNLTEDEQLPVGTTFDTRNGHVTLIAAADKKGKTSTAEFWAGIFKLSQTDKAKPITTLKLVEKLRCGTRGKATAAAKRKKKRRLWGDGKGRFRTEGEFSSATVRGTKWLVEDRCASTLTRVAKGSVSVRDKVKRKTVIVRAGKKYVAKDRS
jgi:hypothetical protein